MAGSKVIVASSVLASVTGVACLSGWGSKFLFPQTVEDKLLGEGFHPLNTDKFPSDEADLSKWIEKLKLAKSDEDNKSYLYILASDVDDLGSRKPKKLDEFKDECYSRLKTSYWSGEYSKSYSVAKKYCVIGR